MQRFTEEFKDVNLEEFYQLPNTTSEIVRLNFKVESNLCLRFFLYYEKGSMCPDFDLPQELMEHIKGYLPEVVQIEFKVNFPENNYPFNPHIWEIVRATSNKFKVDTYFNIIKAHNAYNTADWSPAITIQSDILCVIEKLYDYLYDIENKYVTNIHLNTIKLIKYNENII
jgi:hypothetical protein